jgi:hypothetical protein
MRPGRGAGFQRPCRDADTLLINTGGYASLHHRLISTAPPTLMEFASQQYPKLSHSKGSAIFVIHMRNKIVNFHCVECLDRQRNRRDVNATC